MELNRFKNEPYNFTTSRNIVFSLKDPDLDNPNDGNLDIVKYIASYIQSVEDVIYSDMQTFTDSFQTLMGNVSDFFHSLDNNP